MITDLHDITMAGRFCYAFMCIEKYLVTLYPKVDWTPIARKMWQWTEQYWDESWDIYSQIVPEYIFEFSSYQELNDRSFDGKLDKCDYENIIACYKGITSGNPDDEINIIIKVPTDMGNCTDGASFSWAEPLVYDELGKLEKMIIAHNIELPSKNSLEHFKFTKGQLKNREPWGEFEKTDFLSIIINHK